jgi:hypothetical protein
MYTGLSFHPLSIRTIHVQLYVHIHTFLSLLSISYCDAGSRSSRSRRTFQRARERPRRYYQRETRLDWEPLTSAAVSLSTPFLFFFFFISPLRFSPIQLTSQQAGGPAASSNAQPPRPEREKEREIYIQLCIRDEYTQTQCCCCQQIGYWFIAGWLLLLCSLMKQEGRGVGREVHLISTTI